MMSIMLTNTFVERFGLTKTGAAKQSTLLLELMTRLLEVGGKISIPM